MGVTSNRAMSAYRDSITISQAVGEGYPSRSTLIRRVKSGELSARRIGRVYVLEREELTRCLRSDGLGESDEDARTRAITKQIAASAPRLSPERKAGLSALLQG